jgi:flagellar biosynthetic protein FliQ
MNEAEALQIIQLSFWTVLVASALPIAAAMVVGVSISVLQALTQVQEATLSFVPKIVAVVLVTSAASPFIGATIHAFAAQVFRQIESGGM